MTMPALPNDWATTRTTLQAYGQALTAIPRAAAKHDNRWGHVSMTIAASGLATVPTLLDDGSELVGTIDLTTHAIIITAGGDTKRIELSSGPSSRSVGQAMVDVAADHGTEVNADTERFGGPEGLPYDAAHGEAFLAVARYVLAAFDEINDSVPGEIAGPHLWPHGFDIATEWYSKKLVPHGGSEAAAQIAVGFYPANESYFYANPWPFEDAWSEQPLVAGSTWHLDGWQGAVLPPEGVSHTDIVAFGTAAHTLARDSLSSS